MGAKRDWSLTGYRELAEITTDWCGKEMNSIWPTFLEQGGLFLFFDHLSSTRVSSQPEDHLMEKVLNVIKSKTIRRETKSDLDGPRIPEESIRELDLV